MASLKPSTDLFGDSASHTLHAITSLYLYTFICKMWYGLIEAVHRPVRYKRGLDECMHMHMYMYVYMYIKYM